MSEQQPEEEYRQRKKQLSDDLNTINTKRKRIAWQRLLVVLLTFVIVFQVWEPYPVYVSLAVIGAGIALFLYIVSVDTDAKNKAEQLQHLISINDKEINILTHKFQQYESGEEWKPENHAYANDLDIFGSSSLYQYINRCTSEQGKKRLAQRLLSPSSESFIKNEQEAVNELSRQTLFRQDLAALGAARHLTQRTEDQIMIWKETTMPYREAKWRWLAIIFPVFTFAFLALYVFEILSSQVFSGLIFCCFLVSIAISRNIGAVYDLLSEMVKETETFAGQLALIEKQSFQSPKLKALQQHLQTPDGTTASAELSRLHAILNRFNVRLNTFAFIFVNTFLLWDLQQLLALSKWKDRNANRLDKWFRAIEEVEYTSSLATLCFNQPSWVMPIVSDDFFHITGSEIGHPLLPAANRINNSFSLHGAGTVAVVTGSNMGGKSTFLRSLGVNIVLALAGAPVCAAAFSVSNIRLMSSMRVADNLAESTSTFYAELKKLKTIIEAVNGKEQIFILLDEILRGTNSLDRHTGSVALLKQFIQKEAVAVIATHDVELAKLQEEYPRNIQNYHFDVQANGSELYFDYKLKKGICTSMNASLLMKNIGIEIG